MKSLMPSLTIASYKYMTIVFFRRKAFRQNKTTKKNVYVFGMWRTEARFGSDFETERTHIQAHWMLHEYLYEPMYVSIQHCLDTENESIVANDRHKLKKEDNKAKQHSRRFGAYSVEKRVHFECIHKKPNPNGNHLIFISSKLFMRLEK